MRLSRLSALLASAVAVAALTACAGTDPAGPGSSSPAPGDQPVSGAPGASPPADPGPAVRGTVSGRVTGPGGTPVFGAMVLTRSLDTPAKPIPELAVSTDREGNYSWSLPPGRYELAIVTASQTASGQAPATQAATVQAGQTTTLDFKLN